MMTPETFRAIRLALGLTQLQLTKVLGYRQSSHVAAFEGTGRTARPIPPLVARLMKAYLAGYVPDDWPLRPPQPLPKR